MNPKEVLTRTLESMFGEADFRIFIAHEHEALVRELPGTSATTGHLFAEAVEALARHGRIGEPLFARLRELRPLRRAAIDEARDAWAARTPSDPATGQGTAVPGSCVVLVEELTRDFVGREHIFAAFANFEARLRSEGRGGYFELRGHPGEGKSAIVARLTQRRRCVVHFNQATIGSNTLRAFTREVHAQLAGRHGAEIPMPTGDAARDGTWLLDALAAVRSHSAEELVLAIDALDEVNHIVPPGANPLFLPKYLPVGVHVFVTRRPGGAPLQADCPEERTLASYPVENRGDVDQYIEQFAARETIDRWLQSRAIPRRQFVEALLDRSEENFMYLRHVLPMFAGRDRDDLDIHALPHGLKAYYSDHWRRMGMAGAGASRLKLKILYVLAELRAPVTRTILAEVCEVTATEVQEVLDEWQPFLRARADREVQYSFYHQSFQDFLREQPTLEASGVDLRQVNGWIARWSLKRIPSDD